MSLLPANPIRLGAIGFINTIPIYLPFESRLNVSLHYDTPAHLNDMIHHAQLDVSPVSSAYYWQHQDQLHLLEDLSVSSFGSVESVLFVSKVPLGPEILSLEQIGVPDDSATSIELLSTMLTQEVGQVLQNRFQVYEALNYQAALESYGCALVIGDQALLIHQTELPSQYHIYDLSNWWVQKTGLPFVFAVWVARKPWNVDHAQELKQLQSDLTAARDRFFDREDCLIKGLEAAQERSGLPRERLVHYFKNALDYRFTDAHRQALEQFGKRL